MKISITEGVKIKKSVDNTLLHIEVLAYPSNETDISTLY
jgi:hypothetical protein